uniref:Uncharacterized protein n=1 Tax=Cacopsylla melanoneura TaxID=428564 RepID=A0A8D9E416_9HEMI
MTPLPRSKYTNCRTWNGKSHKDRIPECRKGGVKYHKANNAKSSHHFQRKYHNDTAGSDCQTRGNRRPKDNTRLPNSTTTVSKVITSATSMHIPAITVREIAAKEIMESGTRTTLKRNTRADIPKDVRPKTTSSRMLQLTPDLILLLLHLDL